MKHLPKIALVFAFVLAPLSARAGDEPVRLSTVVTQAKITVTTANTKVLSANTVNGAGGRHTWCVKALSTNTVSVFIKLGTTATTSDMELAAGDSYCEDASMKYLWGGEVDAITSSSSATLNAWEY